MVDIKKMLPELRELVGELAEDLLARSTSDATINAGLKEAFQQIEKGGRTAQAFEVWREDYLDQVAVAWVLACVFVRFMEDNGLIDECWLAGEGERRRLADDTHTLFFREHAHDTDREYFQHVFHEVGKIPAAKDLFAEGKTPLWAVAPSGDAAMKLLKFWREMDAETGHLKRSFQVESGDTRFLGDLYQELSERAKKKFALLQTPVFVEEFILDRTLTPALAEFGLEKVRMIDPTCGSGHFLLGGFARLFDLWSKPNHTTGNAEKDAQKALDGVWGVDINPFAVAIARFRLIVAAVQACGIKRLKQAPGWNIHLASGDSLLFGSKPSFGGERVGISQQMSLFEVPDIYAVEDRKTLQQILGQGYHVVVGNPPYIIVRDRSQNAAYRQLYSTCHQKYSLGVPFTQRFWELAIHQGDDNGGCGYIGLITANSFMKREFGTKLIEDFFPKVDLTHVIDTSGAYIPGHTTSTVILLGRNRSPVGASVRAVLGIKGEAAPPDDPSRGPVWQSIVALLDQSGTQSVFVTSTDVPRTTFASHPWSIGGGGAADLKEFLDEGRASLSTLIETIGFMAIASEDDAFIVPLDWGGRNRIQCQDFATGDNVRDWGLAIQESVIFPYGNSTPLNALELQKSDRAYQHFWKYRTPLRNRLMFGKTPEQHGMKWYEFMHLSRERCGSPLLIPFACVATHNHFCLRRTSVVLNRHAPVIALPHDATEDDYLALVGLLSSSTACFWMKQVMNCKGLGGQGGGIKPEHWSRQYEFAGTAMEAFPIPANYKTLAPLAAKMEELARRCSSLLPEKVVRDSVQGVETRLEQARAEFEALRSRMVFLQEEIDWKTYSLFDFCADTSAAKLLSEQMHPEDRPVERLLKGKMAEGEKSIYYEVHAYRGVSSREVLSCANVQDIIDERMRVIETSPEVRLVEQIDFKRRWQTEPWDVQANRALKDWLLNRLETLKYRKGTKESPELITAAQVADVASADAEFLQVAALYRGRPDFSVAALVSELVEGEAVPFLPILRYKPAGLRKREVWGRTWDLQRQQDAGKDVGDIPVPPKYVSADFLKTDFWRLRGKLDVPKERWISYPHCSTDSDQTLVIGWAGWNHLEQATALIAYYDARKREGWEAKRLTPLLAGLDQLLPWIHQWHPEIDAEFGETAGQSFQTMLEHDAHELGLTLDDVRNWTPPEKVKKTKTSGKKKTTAGEQDDA